MDKPQKLKVSLAEQGYHENWCQRCDKYYCQDCIEFHEIEFDVEENMNKERPDLPKIIQNWKREEVCIWCYNQLIDKAFPPTTDSKKS